MQPLEPENSLRRLPPEAQARILLAMTEVEKAYGTVPALLCLVVGIWTEGFRMMPPKHVESKVICKRLMSDGKQ